MGRITSGIGLASGLNYEEIVKSLISLEARPVQLLADRTQINKGQQAAFLDLSSRLLSLQFSGTSLTSSAVLNARAVSSSNPTVVSATAQANTTTGTYQVRAVRQAQSQQLISTGYATQDNTAVGAGTIKVKLGGFVDPSTSLDQLNGGSGFARGKIRVTDRSGASAVADLTAVRTVADALAAINATGLAIQASTSGDAIVLKDLTGQTVSNLKVEEIGGGTTAASLGIAGSVASATLTGTDVVKLAGGLRLSVLNDGQGVRNAATLDDLRITRKDGVQVNVNLDTATTVQDVLNAINNDAENVGGLVVASIHAGGDKLVLTDTTGGGGTLTVSALNASQAAVDLGVLGTEQAGGVLTGGRILAGLETVLLKDLNGGIGTITPGQVSLKDRSGASATIDLTAATSLAEVVAAVNAAGIGLQAALNAAGHGIRVTDTSGGGGGIEIQDVSGNLATSLHVNVLAAAGAAFKDSGDLNLRFIGENTRFDQLNGGTGILRGKFRITNSAGGAADIDLTSTTKQTIGDVLTAITAAGISVTARINDTGDGILLTDAAGGSGQLTVSELGGSTAAGLRLLGSGATTIDGAFRYEIAIDADDKLTDVVQKLTGSGAPVTASVLNDGNPAAPYRLLVGSSRPGQLGRLVIDTGATSLSLSTLSVAQDAVLEVGGVSGAGLLFASSTNTFTQALTGLTINALGVSGTPVTISVGRDTQGLVTVVGQLVDRFNAALESLEDYTLFDPETTQRGILQSEGLAQQIRDKLLELATGASGSATNSIRGLTQLGVSVADGRLSLDKGALQSRLAGDSAGVEDFLAKAEVGFAKKLETTLKGYTNNVDGAIKGRVDALREQVEEMDERTEFLNDRLEAKRQLLLKQFIQMEQTLAQIQNQGGVLTQLAQLATQSNATRNR